MTSLFTAWIGNATAAYGPAVHPSVASHHAPMFVGSLVALMTMIWRGAVFVATAGYSAVPSWISKFCDAVGDVLNQSIDCVAAAATEGASPRSARACHGL